jgi:hypothetical protein
LVIGESGEATWLSLLGGGQRDQTDDMLTHLVGQGLLERHKSGARPGLTAMHRALTCHDILVEIFESVAHQAKARRQLAWIARCCKTLSEPALDVLWKELDDLIPLLEILPAFQLGRWTYVSRFLDSGGLNTTLLFSGDSRDHP